jgi:hypothetical protein
MATQLEELKECVEDGDSWVEALEQVDIDQMILEGDVAVAEKVKKVLDLISELHEDAGIE